MKKYLVFLCAVGFLLGMAGAASALTIIDTITFTEDGPTEDLIDYGGDTANYLGDWVDVDVNGVPVPVDYIVYAHHFEFDPPADEILSGELVIEFWDNETDVNGNIFTFELGFIFLEDGTYDIFKEIDTLTGDNEDEYTYDIDITTLSLVDGEFGVGIISAGDFWIQTSKLTIDYAPVPEPATMLLLGTGLVGLAGIGRKKFFKKS